VDISELTKIMVKENLMETYDSYNVLLQLLIRIENEEISELNLDP